MRAIGTTAAVAVTDADSPTTHWPCWQRTSEPSTRRMQPVPRRLGAPEARGISEGRPVAVSPLLFDVVEVACVDAVQTAGIVDPTIGTALVELGYDRDFDDMVDHRTAPEGARARPRLVADQARPG